MNNDNNFNPYAPPNGMYPGPNMPQQPPLQQGGYAEDLDSIMQEISQESTAAPAQNAGGFYAESFSDVLVKSIGFFVVCEFLIGTGGLVEKSGVLYAAGNNFLTLYDRETDSYTICDLFSVKFVTVYNSRVRPTTYMPRQQGRMMPNGSGRTMR